MADSYWRYGDSRQPPSSAIPPIVGKRSRSDYDGPGSHDLPGYFPRDDDRGAMRGARDTESINASYDRYLRSTQVSSYGSGQPGRPLGGGMPGRTVDDPRLVGIGGIDPGTTVKDRPLGFAGGRPEVPLPPDASSTLFVEGLPANCTRREVARIFLLVSIILFGISFVLFSSPCAFFFQFVPSLVYTDIFRPFVGYKEVRLVSKESRHPGGDPLVLCFVDFLSPAHAATAMDALQGYKFDEHDRDSVNLRLQFARYPGARSGGGPRGKR